MDSLITAAARALAAGDPLGALKRVALREDAPALALRGIAMAQLGDLVRAKDLLKRAGRAFGPREARARARCTVAEAEIALVSRDLSWPPAALEAAGAVLAAHGDRINAAHAGLIAARRLLLIGRLDEAGRALAALDPDPLPPAWRAAHHLVAAGLAIRRLQAGPAKQAVERAGAAAAAAGIASIAAEVETVRRELARPSARLRVDGQERPLRLDEVEALFASDRLVVDACRGAVRLGDATVPLARRPVLFALARSLAGAFPSDVTRTALVRDAFGGREADESHRARLRVEIGRLRRAIAPLAGIEATRLGFVLAPRAGGGLALLLPPVEEPHAAVLALLADGEAWASSALALALDMSPRSVQRALERLAAEGKAESFGQGRARRWLSRAVPGFPSALLLPTPAPID